MNLTASHRTVLTSPALLRASPVLRMAPHIVSQTRSYSFNALNSYKKSLLNQKILTFIYNGCRVLDQKQPYHLDPTLLQVTRIWNEVKKEQRTSSPLDGQVLLNDSQRLGSCCVNICKAIDPVDANVQRGQIAQNLRDFIQIYVEKTEVENALTQGPFKWGYLPFARDHSPDTEACIENLNKLLIEEYSKQDKEFVLIEDGCASGEALVDLVSRLQTSTINVFALGTDIRPLHLSMARIAAKIARIEDQTRFAAGNIFYRAPARTISSSHNYKFTNHPHIVIGLKLIPVLNNLEIHSYMARVSQEMRFNDRWFGSIAAQEGELFEYYRDAFEQKKEGKLDQKHRCFTINRFDDPLTGITFVYNPFAAELQRLRVTLPHLVKHLISAAEEMKVELKSTSEKDVTECVLNTYMQLEGFEKLANKYNLKLAKEFSPLEVKDREGNKKIIVCLQKK